MPSTPTWTLAASLAMILLTAIIYTYVGRIVTSRPVSHRDARRASQLFGVWWFSLAGLTVLGGIRLLLGAMGIDHVQLHASLTYVSLVPLVAAIWGLFYYLIYIYTGRSSLFVPVTVAHGLILVFFTYIFTAMRPIGVEVGTWTVKLVYARPLEGPLQLLVLAVLLGPILTAAVLYASLYFKARDATTRYRVAVVSGAFIFWFGTSGVAAATPLSDWDWWPFASRFVGLIATLIILSAYRPPRFVQRWFDAQPSPIPSAPLREEPDSPRTATC